MLAVLLQLSAVAAVTEWIPLPAGIRGLPVESRCPGVAVRDVSALSRAAFVREFRGARPVLLRSPALLAARGRWARGALLECCAGEVVQVGADARSIVTNHGEGAANATLSEFLETRMLAAGGGRAQPAYLFDRSQFARQPRGREQLRTVPFPPLLLPQDRSMEGFSMQDGLDIYLLIGGANASVGFHDHADSLVAVLHGAKRWFLYPPHRIPAPSWRSRRGMAEAPVAAVAGSVQCVQLPGEFLYVPEGWSHAVLNLGETVAVAQQQKVPHGEYFRRRLLAQQLASAREFKDSRRIAMETVRKWPERAEAHAALAHNLLEELEPPSTLTEEQVRAALKIAEACLRKAISLDATDSVSAANLCKVYVQTGRLADAALAVCTQAVLQDGASYNALFWLGRMRLGRKEFAAAAKHLQRCTLVDPLAPEGHYQLAAALLTFDRGVSKELVRKVAKLQLRRCAEGRGDCERLRDVDANTAALWGDLQANKGEL